MKVMMELFVMEGCCPVLRPHALKKLQKNALGALFPVVSASRRSNTSSAEGRGNGRGLFESSSEKSRSSLDEPAEAPPTSEETRSDSGSDV